MTKIKILLLSTLFCFTFLSNFGQEKSGMPIRGKIVWVQPGTNDTLPLTDTKVALFNQNTTTKEWNNLGSGITNTQGFYFFTVSVPGEYFVQVNNRKNYKIVVQKTETVLPVQDMPLIIFDIELLKSKKK
jgi:hypothetical protein